MRALAFAAFLILCIITLASCGHKTSLQLPEPEEAPVEYAEPEA